MLRWIARFLLVRVLGGRALAVLAIVGFIRRILGGRRATVIARTRATPPPSAAAPGSPSPPP